jgi:hypothetical protein
MLHICDMTFFAGEHLLICYTSADRAKNPARVYVEQRLECRDSPEAIATHQHKITLICSLNPLSTFLTKQDFWFIKRTTLRNE